jgi:hypothetical protein
VTFTINFSFNVVAIGAAFVTFVTTHTGATAHSIRFLFEVTACCSGSQGSTEGFSIGLALEGDHQERNNECKRLHVCIFEKLEKQQLVVFRPLKLQEKRILWDKLLCDIHVDALVGKDKESPTENFNDIGIALEVRIYKAHDYQRIDFSESCMTKGHAGRLQY